MGKVRLIRLLIMVLTYYYPNSLFGQVTQIKWMSLQEIEFAEVAHPRKVIIEVYSKDCEWCKKFESEVLVNPVIANYINQYYYIAKVDVFDKTTIRFRNKELLSTNGFHPLTAEYLKGQTPLSFPTQLFFDEKFEFLNFLKGYNTVGNFEMAIAYFGEDFYKTSNWDKFLKSFKRKTK